MQTRFLLGPSGTGKTWRFLSEIRNALRDSAEGAPLLLLAPRQATFQLERQLLADGGIPGYSRLQILSFERLAEFVLNTLGQSPPRLISEDGRLMVFRALLSRRRDELKVFRSTAHLRGFARQLSLTLRELQRFQCNPARLLQAAEKLDSSEPLHAKIHDLGHLLTCYLQWLADHQLQDADQLLTLAAGQWRASQRAADGTNPSRLAGIWVDGFAEVSPQEMELLAELAPWPDQLSIALNLDLEAAEQPSWLSTWAGATQTFNKLHQRLSAVPGNEVCIETLERSAVMGRFAGNPVIAHLERFWNSPEPFQPRPDGDPATDDAGIRSSLRVAACPNPEMEARLAAREILLHVRSGGRFRDAAVLVRLLDDYVEVVRRVFTDYEIPFFLDRREAVGHHPLAELTRSALRTVALGWLPEDWFATLKTGLVSPDEGGIDLLENETLAHGWRGAMWLRPLPFPTESPVAAWMEKLRLEIVPPLQRLGFALEGNPSGPVVAEALKQFWDDLDVARRLEQWENGKTEGGSSVQALHSTVWNEMQRWLQDLQLAFAQEPMPLREWLPIIEAGLAGLTIGVIPPALDQVLVGAIDRSRNPDLRLCVILGLNENVFPRVAAPPALLTEPERERLERAGLPLGPGPLQRLGQERYLGYIACTRSSGRLVLAYSEFDENDRKRNPSPFISHVRKLFPGLASEPFSGCARPEDVEHSSELGEVLGRRNPPGGDAAALIRTLGAAGILCGAVMDQFLPVLNASDGVLKVSPALVERLYTRTLALSVSTLEQFAACPFKFFISAGLKAEERKLFEFDARERGTFQHELLALFHEQLAGEGKRWRDITPAEARLRIRALAEQALPGFRDGLLIETTQARFEARNLAAALETFIETVVRWMSQYAFDPAAVELGFGLEPDSLPAWELDLESGHRLAFRGKIDRVDLWRDPSTESAACVVIDYKSSSRKIDPVLAEHGVQLQLPAYLTYLRALADPMRAFGIRRLVPAGVFFVNLRAESKPVKHRGEALSPGDGASAYQHAGRFNQEFLKLLDRRDAEAGDQFNYRLTKTGKVHGACRDPVQAAEFQQMLDRVEKHLRRMGREIFGGVVSIDPYRKGTGTACDRCDYQAICRIDPWTHSFRVLRANGAEGEGAIE